MRRPCIECGRPTHGRVCTGCGGPGHPIETSHAYNSMAYRTARRALLATATVCHWCTMPGTADDPLTADHITPLADGGPPAGPLVAAHRSCNSRRGANTERDHLDLAARPGGQKNLSAKSTLVLPCKLELLCTGLGTGRMVV